jgi:hypothetical protein
MLEENRGGRNEMGPLVVAEGGKAFEGVARLLRWDGEELGRRDVREETKTRGMSKAERKTEKELKTKSPPFAKTAKGRPPWGICIAKVAKALDFGSKEGWRNGLGPIQYATREFEDRNSGDPRAQRGMARRR